MVLFKYYLKNNILGENAVRNLGVLCLLVLCWLHWLHYTIFEIYEKIIGAEKNLTIREVTLQFKENDSIHHVDVYFTSKQNAYGALAKQWFEGDIRQLTLKPNSEAAVAVKVARSSSLEMEGYCNKTSSFYQCLSTKFDKMSIEDSNCSRWCGHMSLPKMENQTVLPDCQTQEEILCNERQALFS